MVRSALALAPAQDHDDGTGLGSVEVCWCPPSASWPYHGYVVPDEQRARETRVICVIHADRITLDAIHH